jgi:hypothetical protein
MKYGKESLIGAGPTPGERLSNVMLTTRGGKIWYAHVLPDFKKQVYVMTSCRPKSLILLSTGEKVPFTFLGGSIYFNLKDSRRTNMDDVVKITL